MSFNNKMWQNTQKDWLLHCCMLGNLRMRKKKLFSSLFFHFYQCLDLSISEKYHAIIITTLPLLSYLNLFLCSSNSPNIKHSGTQQSFPSAVLLYSSFPIRWKQIQAPGLKISMLFYYYALCICMNCSSEVHRHTVHLPGCVSIYSQ